MLEVQGTGPGVSRPNWVNHSDTAAAAEVAALGMWLFQPSILWALVAFGLGAVAVVLAARGGRKLLVAATLMGLLGATTAGVTSGRVRTVERHWDDVREQLISN